MRKISHYSEEFEVKVAAACLMPNHYHFLLHQLSDQSAGLLVQRVFNSYTKALNKAYSRTGTLFESPFKAKMVDKDEYLSHLCWYIHTNPVSAGLVRRVEDWNYSNYLECVGKRKRWAFDGEFITAFFGSATGYEDFVRSYESISISKHDENMREYFLDK